MEKQKREEVRFQILLHGGKDIEENTGKGKTESLVFPDPSTYENLSEEEKKQKTEEMKKKLSVLKDIKTLGTIENASRC
jgi:hypothetical protein